MKLIVTTSSNVLKQQKKTVSILLLRSHPSECYSMQNCFIYTLFLALLSSDSHLWALAWIAAVMFKMLKETFSIADLITKKSRGLSPAVALLRKRLPPLEELRLDEEVATYTSVSVSTAPGFVPPRPRCGNPLASILHFEESSVSTLLMVKCDWCCLKQFDLNQAT